VATKATDDPKELAAYFAGFPRNVGIVCGPSRLLVVDEDKPGGFETYAASIGQAIPATYTVQIGKGRHFYFDATDHPELGNAPGCRRSTAAMFAVRAATWSASARCTRAERCTK
jgi:hypothetical protein